MKRRLLKQQPMKCVIDYEKLAEIIPHTSEIDYERLSNSVADAIVKRETDDRNSYSAPREWMKYIIHASTDIMSLIFLIAALFLGYLLVTSLSEFHSIHGFNVDLLKLFVKATTYAGFMFFAFSLSISTFFLGKDIEEEKDRHFVAAVFSNVTSLVALIVALIALLMEVF